MKRNDIAPIRFLHRNLAWVQFACVLVVSLIVVLGPILLYGLLFQPGSSARQIIGIIPWWPVLLVVLLVAVLSLVHGSTGISVQKRTRGDIATKNTGDVCEHPASQSTRRTSANQSTISRR